MHSYVLNFYCCEQVTLDALFVGVVCIPPPIGGYKRSVTEDKSE